MPFYVTFLNEIPRSVLISGVALCAIYIFIAYYRFSIPAGIWTRGILALLRSLLLGVFLFVLLDPYWNRTSGKEWVGVLIDTSQSMAVKDEGAEESRLELWKRHMASEEFEKLIPKDKVRRIMTVDEGLEDARDLSGLEASGKASRLLSAVKILNTEYSADRDLLGWILISDGASTDYPDQVRDWPPNLYFPWLSIGMGKPGNVPNVSLQAVNVAPQAFINEIIPFEIEWTSTMPYDAACEISISVDGAPGEQKKLMCGDEQYKTHISFPDKGSHAIDVRIETPVKEGSVDDNDLRVWVDATPRLIRVFYSESFYKDKNDFKMALEEDADFEVEFASSLIGFARHNSVPFIKDPIHGMPQTREKMLSFDTIVLSDVRRNLLTADQIQWIRQLVEDYGGALIMVGGVDSFGDGGYVGSDIEKMLPVEISEEYKKNVFLAAKGTVENPFRPVIAPGQEKHPVLQIVDDPDKNLSLWGSMPLLGGYNYVGRLKPGADLILQHPVDVSTFGPRIILAVQNYGKGKTLAFTSDITYNWGQWFLNWRTENDGWLYARFWRGVIKWLTEKRLRRAVLPLDIEILPPVESERPVTVKVLVPDEGYQGSSLELKVFRNDESIAARHFDDLTERNVSWEIPNLEAGDYVLNAAWHGVNLPPVSQNHLFRVHPSRTETRRLTADPNFLAELAYRSKGEYITFDQKAKINDVLQKIRKRHLRQRSFPFWDQPAVYLLILFLLFADWFIRKKKGLE